MTDQMPGLTRVGGVVVLHGPMLSDVLQLVLIAARARRHNGLPITSAATALAHAVNAAMSANGQSDVPEPVALPSFPTTEPTVTVEDAAQQLGLSRRQTRRLAPKLGGRIRAGQWRLDQHAIDEHLTGQPVDRDRMIAALAAMTDDEFRQLTTEARPPQPVDPVSARRSIAGKAGDLLSLPRDRNGLVGSFAAATAARQPTPQPKPTVGTQQFQPPPDTGYTGSASLRRTPFITPAPTTTTQ